MHKINLLFAAVLIPFLAMVTIAALHSFEKQLERNSDQSARILTRVEAQRIEAHFASMEELGIHSARFLRRILDRQPDERSLASFDERYSIKGGALRTNLFAHDNQDISGVFLSNKGELNQRVKSHIVNTETVFDYYAKGTRTTVFNMYLITVDQLIRIYEKDWALEVEADHDFSEDSFFYAATPRNNPEKKPVWTEPYYDSIWKHWMTSLITPIYVDGEFMGIVGHDVVLDDIYHQVLSKRVFTSGYGVLFDSQANIVINPKHLEMPPASRMGAPLRTHDLGEPELIQVVDRANQAFNSGENCFTDRFAMNGKGHLFTVTQLDFLDWRYGLIIPVDEIEAELPILRSRLIAGAAISVAVILVLTMLLAWRHVVAPIVKISKATEEIGAGNFDYRVHHDTTDEAGKLARSINSMAQNLKEMTRSLEESNEELQMEVTERAEIQRELLKIRVYLTGVIDSMPSVLVGIDPDGRVSNMNERAAKLCGIPAGEAVGRRFSELFDNYGTLEAELLETTGRGDVYEAHGITDITKEDTRIINMTAYPLEGPKETGAVIRLDDVTRKTRMEELAVQSEKMMSVGGLAAGMAHEINNPLAGIMQCIQVILNRLNPELKANKKVAQRESLSLEGAVKYVEARGITTMLKETHEAGRRASRIVENMLSFARKSDSSSIPCEVSKLMDDTLELASSDYDLAGSYDFKKIEIVKEYEKVPSVVCDGSKIQQVLLNLISNAAQEMAADGQKQPAKLILRIIDESTHVRMEIEDNGPGMSEKLTKRVFEPFFTTKDVGKGTGLGLSVSYYIVTENHKGELFVESEKGAWTRFVIRLPISHQD